MFDLICKNGDINCSGVSFSWQMHDSNNRLCISKARRHENRYSNSTGLHLMLQVKVSGTRRGTVKRVQRLLPTTITSCFLEISQASWWEWLDLMNYRATGRWSHHLYLSLRRVFTVMKIPCIFRFPVSLHLHVGTRLSSLSAFSPISPEMLFAAILLSALFPFFPRNMTFSLTHGRSPQKFARRPLQFARCLRGCSRWYSYTKQCIVILHATKSLLSYRNLPKYLHRFFSICSVILRQVVLGQHNLIFLSCNRRPTRSRRADGYL